MRKPITVLVVSLILTGFAFAGVVKKDEGGSQFQGVWKILVRTED